MSEHESIAQSWLRYVYYWLNRFEKENVLSDPANLLLIKLENKRKESDSKEVWGAINDLKRLSEKSDSKEAAEIKLCCGMVAADMKDFHDALRLFTEASSKYASFKHQHAIAQWMIGCAQWLLPKREVDAINSWRTSLRIFESLCNHNKGDKENYKWYDEKCKEMQEALHIAAEEYKIPPLPESAAEWNKPDNLATKTSQLKYKTALETSSNGQNFSGEHDDSFSRGRLKTIPVFDHIAAGDFDASGVLAQPVAHVETDRILIEDIPHRVHSLTNAQVVNLPGSQEHFVLKVSGNSMNQSKPVPIEDGDYVLMRRQAVPDNGNLVAAEIVREDTQATLKRYRFLNGQHILQPESNDPAFQDRILMKNEFFIRGVGLAVFKKMRR